MYCFFVSSSLQFNDNICCPSHAPQQWRMRTRGMGEEWETSHATDTLVPWPQTRACVANCGKTPKKMQKNSSRNISAAWRVSVCILIGVFKWTAVQKQTKGSPSIWNCCIKAAQKHEILPRELLLLCYGIIRGDQDFEKEMRSLWDALMDLPYL